MEEIWKDITGFDGYQLSNLGRVRSLHGHGKVYNEYALKTFGEFAVLNILPEEIN